MSSNLKKKRTAEIKRKTKETDIVINLNLDGKGKSKISTSIPILNHMLELFSKHSGINLEISAEGDLPHHVVEDIGISLGQAISKALGKKKGIRRFGDKTLPMDEVLATCALDLSGRGYYKIDRKMQGVIEGMDTENLIHFFESLALNAKMNLHINIHYGFNVHHKCEVAFKSFARAFREAIEIIDEEIPSTKGAL